MRPSAVQVENATSTTASGASRSITELQTTLDDWHCQCTRRPRPSKKSAALTIATKAQIKRGDGYVTAGH